MSSFKRVFNEGGKLSCAAITRGHLVIKCRRDLLYAKKNNRRSGQQGGGGADWLESKFLITNMVSFTPDSFFKLIFTQIGLDNFFDFFQENSSRSNLIFRGLTYDVF